MYIFAQSSTGVLYNNWIEIKLYFTLLYLLRVCPWKKHAELCSSNRRFGVLLKVLQGILKYRSVTRKLFLLGSSTLLSISRAKNGKVCCGQRNILKRERIKINKKVLSHPHSACDSCLVSWEAHRLQHDSACNEIKFKKKTLLTRRRQCFNNQAKSTGFDKKKKQTKQKKKKTRTHSNAQGKEPTQVY